MNGAGTCQDCRIQADVERPPLVCAFGVENGTEAAVYVAIQTSDDVYSPETGLGRGTIFPGLDKPFFGAGGEVNCRGRNQNV